MAGPEKSSVDLMFFKFFKNKDDTNSKLLFFNRNRVSITNDMKTSGTMPLFSFTEAVSYNTPKLKGFAPVLVGQVLSWAVLPKAGIQYAYLRPNLTIFSWLVTETIEDPALDYYILGRYTPKISGETHLFTQGESLSVFPHISENIQIYNRLRLGLSKHDWQYGFALDNSFIGRNTFNPNTNWGLFIRHEFK